VRAARAGDLGALAGVERDGDRRFADGGSPVGVVTEKTVPMVVLEAARQEGRLWVAVSARGEEAHGDIVGFALAEIIDGRGHLTQVSVRRAYQGTGVGRVLVEAVIGWARRTRREAVTLCTFADVPWNRPLYEHLGFAVLPEESWTPGIRAAVAEEGRRGLPAGRRVVMLHPLPAAD